MRLGKNMQNALEFIRKVNGWHSYHNNRATREAIKRLEKRSLVETNKYQQFRATLKAKAEMGGD